MGEIAEAMLNGELCEMCGDPIYCIGYGIPMYCSLACAKARGATEDQVCTLKDYDNDEDTEYE